MWPLTTDRPIPTAPVLLTAGGALNRYSASLDYDWFTFVLP
jgi:hypothetical protein